MHSREHPAQLGNGSRAARAAEAQFTRAATSAPKAEVDGVAPATGGLLLLIEPERPVALVAVGSLRASGAERRGRVPLGRYLYQCGAVAGCLTDEFDGKRVDSQFAVTHGQFGLREVALNRLKVSNLDESLRLGAD